MNLLIDIGHPAHIHYYRNFTSVLISKGYKIFWSIKDSVILRRLLDLYGFEYIVLPKKNDSILGKAINQIRYDYILWRFCNNNKINLAIGSSATIAHVSKLSKTESIVFDDDDDDVQPLYTKFITPFISILFSPDALTGKRKRKDTIYFFGYQELNYLHPNWFTPNPDVLKEDGIKVGETYFIVRFNAFKAHHDIGVSGISLENKRRLIEYLSAKGKVFITSENKIEPEFEQYQIKISPEKIHSFIYYATMLVGDSQTMTSEAAVLGVPALKCNTFAGKLSVPNELEHKYDLCYAYLPEDFDKMLIKIDELLKIKNLKHIWQEKRQKMLNEKIDVTAFFIWFIENYPKSAEIMRTNPEFQYNFR